jgi:hypothetical protein
MGGPSPSLGSLHNSRSTGRFFEHITKRGVNIVETRDFEPVWEIFRSPEVFYRVNDDTTLYWPVDKWRAVMRRVVDDPNNHLFLVMDDGKPVGCFMCLAKGDGCLELHTMMTSACRGKAAVLAGKEFTRAALNLPGITRLTSFCPANMPETLLYARMVGWKRGEIHERKWAQNGEEWTMRVVGIDKENLNLCQ